MFAPPTEDYAEDFKEQRIKKCADAICEVLLKNSFILGGTKEVLLPGVTHLVKGVVKEHVLGSAALGEKSLEILSSESSALTRGAVDGKEIRVILFDHFLKAETRKLERAIEEDKVNGPVDIPSLKASIFNTVKFD